MAEQAYTLAQLDQLIAGARRLGFADDVAHWTAERARLLEAGDVDRHHEHMATGSPVLDAGCVWCETWMHSLEVAAGLVTEPQDSGSSS